MSGSFDSPDFIRGYSGWTLRVRKWIPAVRRNDPSIWPMYHRPRKRAHAMCPYRVPNNLGGCHPPLPAAMEQRGPDPYSI